MSVPTRSAVAMSALAALGALSAAAAQMPDHPFEVGTPFPTISLPSLADGRPASIADFRGQKVILHVFASW